MLKNKYNIEFLKHVRRECRRYGIKLILTSDDSFTYNGQSYGGYFDHIDMEIGITQKHNENLFISLLVHEFSHMEQWIDKDPTYTRHLRGGYDSAIIMNNWLDGTEYERKTIINAIGIVRDCELNCERRAIKNINKYKLPLELDNYCREANAYIMFYNYIIYKRIWEFDRPPTLIDEIVQEMPNDLYSLNYNIMSTHYYDLFDKYLIVSA